MKLRAKLRTILRGSKSLTILFALLLLSYVMSKYLKKKTLQVRIVGALIDSGLSPIVADYAFAQAAHETGNFTSPLFLTNKNCFGMKFPQVRSTTAERERLGYAYYKTIEDSAKDYALYYKYVRLTNAVLSIDQFVTGLRDKGYFEAGIDEYMNGVKHWYKFYYDA